MTRPLAGIVLALVLLGMPALVLSSQAATTGFLEVCKAADGPGVTGTFSFSVAGQSVEVPVGACSAAIQLPPGTVTVTETARPGSVVTGIRASPSHRLASSDPAGRSAQVTIVAGDISTQSIVTFANRVETGQLKVCKVAGPGVATGTIFAFHAAGQTLTVPAGPGPGGFCSVAGAFPVGTSVTVSEAVPAGLEVSAISVAPPERAGGPADLATASQVATIGSGVTEVTFTNRQAPSAVPVPQGFLRICKRAEGPGVSGVFTFTVAGQAHDVAVNGCSPVLQLPAGTVTVTETARPGTVLAGIEVEPPTRLVGRDLAARWARVSVVAGDIGTQTVATFVNRAEIGQLKVCKVAGTGVAVGTQFAFRAAGAALTVPAGPAPGGFCVLGGAFPVGTNVTVSEIVPAGLEVSAVSVAPPERAGGPADLAVAAQVATIGSGVTEVTFTNRAESRPTTTTTAPASTTTTAIGVSPTTIAPPTTFPPTTFPPTTFPPTTFPPTTFPPITFPPITFPPITFPPITLPTTTTTGPTTTTTGSTTTTLPSTSTTTTTALVPPTTATTATTLPVPPTTTTTVPAGGVLPTTSTTTTTIPGSGVLPTTLPPTSPTTAPTTTSPAPTTTSPAPTTTSPAPTTTSPAPTTTSPAPIPIRPAIQAATLPPRSVLPATGRSPFLALLAGALLVLGAAAAVTGHGPVLVSPSEQRLSGPSPSRGGHGTTSAPAASPPADDLYRLPPRVPPARPRRRRAASAPPTPHRRPTP